MPGHPIPPELTEQAKAQVAQLEALFDAHDVVYLLMDSRESRWLPTLLGASKKKVNFQPFIQFNQKKK
jgi:ubiquitin-like modifier-activating enzyme ATG7